MNSNVNLLAILKDNDIVQAVEQTDRHAGFLHVDLGLQQVESKALNYSR